MVSPSEFMHPEDKAALRQLENIPGFPAIARKVLEIGIEKLLYGLNMASTIRLSKSQLPEIYNHLPPICQKLGIPEPEFYLEMNPVPNAYTNGDKKVFIVVTSGLIELLDGEELDAVLAHECGHILCHHVLYHMVARSIKDGLNYLGILGSLAAPVQFALLYWCRKSELSCDRCSCIITSPETVTRVMARLAGGPKSITKNINMQEWALQADQYDAIRNDGLWNKTLQIAAVMGQDHPFSAVRAREVIKWGQSAEYRNIKNSQRPRVQGRVCPNCYRPVNYAWTYCKYCGTKL